MTKKGKGLIAPLEAMLIAARQDLPQVADAFLDANREVAETTYSDDALVGRRTYEPWRQLRDEFQRNLGETANTIARSARALERVVECYCETDDEAAAGLKSSTDDTAYSRRPHIGEPETPEE